MFLPTLYGNHNHSLLYPTRTIIIKWKLNDDEMLECREVALSIHPHPTDGKTVTSFTSKTQSLLLIQDMRTLPSLLNYCN